MCVSAQPAVAAVALSLLLLAAEATGQTDYSNQGITSLATVLPCDAVGHVSCNTGGVRRASLSLHLHARRTRTSEHTRWHAQHVCRHSSKITSPSPTSHTPTHTHTHTHTHTQTHTHTHTHSHTHALFVRRCLISHQMPSRSFLRTHSLVCPASTG
jgi:hypothetical protein